jgi:hypothetical protein
VSKRKRPQARPGKRRHDPKPRRAARVEASATTLPYWATGVYRDRLERLRTLVTKSFLWAKPTKRHQREVKKYHDYIFGTETEPRAFSADKHAYKPKRKDRLRIAQDYAQMPEGFDAINVAFMPYLGEGTRYRFRADGELVIRNQHIERTFRPFDRQRVWDAAAEADAKYAGEPLSEQQALAALKAGEYQSDFLESFIDYVAEVIEGDPPDTLYQLQVGEHAFGGYDGIAMGKEALIKTLIRMFAMYFDDIGKWLAGLSIFRFHDQAEYTGFDDEAKQLELARAIDKKRRRTERKEREQRRERAAMKRAAKKRRQDQRKQR